MNNTQFNTYKKVAKKKNSSFLFLGIAAILLVTIVLTSLALFQNEKNIHIASAQYIKSDNCLYDVGYTWDFPYNGTDGSDGSVQEFPVACSGTYKIEVWGASGASCLDSLSYGYGGYSVGEVQLNKANTAKLYLYVGGEGSSDGEHGEQSGGFNGGGNAVSDYDGNTKQASGGGATHVATISGELSELETYKGTLADNELYYVSDKILIVAGGGGGAGRNSVIGGGTGGNGGGYIGGNGNPNPYSSLYGSGGTQTTPGKSSNEENTGYVGTGYFGQGYSGIYAGGGGGFYGGGVADGSTGGGSGYIASNLLTNKAMYCYNCTENLVDNNIKTISTTGNNNALDVINCPNGYSDQAVSKCAKLGNGHARITYLGNASMLTESNYAYTIKRNINSSSSEWERLNLNVGKVANAQLGTTPVQNDFDNIYPWSDIKTYDYNTVTGEKVWIDEEGFTFSPTGNVEVLTYIPEFYYQRYRDGNDEYISISKLALPGYTRSAPFSVGRYLMNVESDTGHSRSGTEPKREINITDARTYAKNLGSNFGLMDYHYFLIQLLYLVEYADYDSQTILGTGYTYPSNYKPLDNGQKIGGYSANDLGMKSGSIHETISCAANYRGIENVFGNVWQFIDGINIKDYKAYICYDQKQYAADTFTGCYKEIGYTNATSDDYISKLGYDANYPLVAFPTEVGESAGISDKYWQNPGNRMALVGGRYGNGTTAGLWSWDLDYESSFTGPHVGGRIMKLEN